MVGLALDDLIWDHTTFSKNRDRLLAHRVVEGFFAEVMRVAEARSLPSKEHFSVDGNEDTLRCRGTPNIVKRIS